MGTTTWPMTHHGRRVSDRGEPGLVSVIIPSYNRAHMVPEAMDSVWAQTYRPIELIVVDDGSTDDTREVVARWRERCAADDGFRVGYVYQPNSGLPASRNVGAIASRGAYLQFLDSDDYLHPDRFRRVLDRAASVPGFEVAVTGYEFVSEDRRPLEPRPPVDLTAADRLERCIRRPLWAASPVYARRFFRTVGFFRPNLRFGEDWEYGIRVAIRCTPERCVLLDEPLVAYRMHPGPRIITARRARRDIPDLLSAANAVLERGGFEQRYVEMLALGLLLWFSRHGDPAYLRQAMTMRCSAGLKAKIALLLLLGTVCDGRALVRRWYRRRGVDIRQGLAGPGFMRR